MKPACSPTIDAVTELLGLDPRVSLLLQMFPHKSWDKPIPTDPVIYRWYELVGVYGETIKELIHELFGDGIMSAIDFTMDIDKQEDPKGDRVAVDISLPADTKLRANIQLRGLHTYVVAVARPQMQDMRQQGYGFSILVACQVMDLKSAHNAFFG